MKPKVLKSPYPPSQRRQGPLNASLKHYPIFHVVVMWNFSSKLFKSQELVIFLVFFTVRAHLYWLVCLCTYSRHISHTDLFLWIRHLHGWCVLQKCFTWELRLPNSWACVVWEMLCLGLTLRRLIAYRILGWWLLSLNPFKSLCFHYFLTVDEKASSSFASNVFSLLMFSGFALCL